MNGPEHYREAEKRIELVEAMYWDTSTDHAVASLHIALAKAHAALAQVAATMDVAGATANGVVTTGWSDAIQPPEYRTLS